jgi:nucleoside-diphosphate-sugar epimerase
MRWLITGAAGFLGRHVVDRALERGHQVLALMRPSNDPVLVSGSGGPEIEILRCDLRHPDGLARALRDVDGVIHLAAAKSGDLYTQLAGTVVATENLLQAMVASDCSRIVHVSTFSVYDYRKMWSLSRLDEKSPIESRPEDRDEYAQTKLVQERLVREYASRHGWWWTALRPGVVWGSGNLWNARIGVPLSDRTWLRIGGWARLPLTHVENCADAIVTCAEKEEANGEIFNVVDDDLPPTRREYTAAVAQCSEPRPRILPVPWILMRCMARGAWLVNRLFLGGRARMPGIFVPAKLLARFKHLRFSNRKIREVLRWKPPYGFMEALKRSTATEAEVPESRKTT